MSGINQSFYQIMAAAIANMPNFFLTKGRPVRASGLGTRKVRGYNKYTPHQGEQEKARRRRQIARGIIQVG